jgi:hypothetical protein
LIGMLLLLAIAFSVAGCSGVSQPFGKPEGSNASLNEILPPAETFRQAGPGAENDLDYETVYGPGALPPDSTVALANPEQPANSPTIHQDEPAADAPMAEGAKTVAEKPKGNGSEIKAVAVVPVQGAPGQGNAELTAAMRETLSSAGWPVVNSPREDALTVSGVVSLAKPQGAAQKVTLSWTVTTFKGAVLGTIKQANDVPPGSLDKSWGEAAHYATEAGATGIYDLVKRFR